MKLKLIKYILVLVFAFVVFAGYAQHALTLKIDEVESNDGDILIAVFDNPEFFPTKGKKACIKKKVKAEKGIMTVTIANIPKGVYAVSIVHDENANGDMDMFLVVPTEGYAMSNDAKGSFGPPEFEDAKFQLAEDKIIVMKMHY